MTYSLYKQKECKFIDNIEIETEIMPGDMIIYKGKNYIVQDIGRIFNVDTKHIIRSLYVEPINEDVVFK